MPLACSYNLPFSHVLKCCLTTGLICLSIHLITVFLPLSPSHTLSALYDRPDPIDRWSEEKDQKKETKQTSKTDKHVVLVSALLLLPPFCPVVSLLNIRARGRASERSCLSLSLSLLIYCFTVSVSVSQLLSYLVVQFDDRRVSVVLHGDTR